MKIFSLFLLCALFFSRPAKADWTAAMGPAACDLTASAFQSLKQEGYAPWVVSSFAPEKNTQVVMLIWRSIRDRGSILVTISRDQNQVTCIVAAGDNNTEVLEDSR